MKQVRESDLASLITSFYCKFIAHISENEHYELPCKKTVKVNIKSTHIVVWWYFKEESDQKYNTEKFIKDFAEKIEEVSFGNLKVIYYGIEDKDQKEQAFEIYIANAYDVIE